MKRILILVLAIVLGSSVRSWSQGLNADGKDFYLGLLYPSFNAQSINFFGRNVQGFFGVYALISSYEDNVITLGYFDDNGNEINQQTYNVAKHRSVQVPLDIAHMRMTEPGEIAEYKSCHIMAKKPVNVQFFSTGSCSGGSYLALSTGMLGKTYVVESYHDNEGGVGGALSNEDASGYFMVIAAFDSTTVVITPSSTTKKKHAGVNCGSGATGVPQPFTINLHRGQCYMVKGAADGSGCDISNSTVIADKPVAVIAGHENAFTDGSDPQPGGARTLEARDYMVEQMIPVEYWDSVGYVSIPFVDSQAPFNAGEGDEYQVFTGVIKELGGSGPAGSDIKMNDGGRFYKGIAEYQVPPPQLLNWTSPVDFSSTNGTKIGVAMYDQRMQGGGAPYPAPSQTTIIPKSRWKKSFLWNVPNNTFEIMQGYYINLICNRSDYDNNKILIGVNGGKLAPLPNGLAVKRKYATIPDYPDLVGYSIALSPGAYYATADTGNTHPFMIYNYGFRAIDPDRDLGDFCGDDHFFAYSLPVGFDLPGKQIPMGATVDTGCATWHVCVHTSHGIRQVSLLRDTIGTFTTSGGISYNTEFDPTIDVNGTGELNLSGNDTTYCFDVQAIQPLDSARAVVYVLNSEGNWYSLDLRSTGTRLTLDIPQSWQGPTGGIVFPQVLVPHDTCVTVRLYNNASKGSAGETVSDVRLATTSSAIRLTNVSPAPPLVLSPGDSLTATICFTALDTMPAYNELRITTSCPLSKIPITAQGSMPRIAATDLRNLVSKIGDRKCTTVVVRNVGNVAITLRSAVSTQGSRFHLDTAGLPRLPYYLRPHDSVAFGVCFRPDSIGTFNDTIEWLTDVAPPLTDSIKRFSYLQGKGVRPVLTWSGDEIFIFADSLTNSPVGIRRAILSNQSTTAAVVTRVGFIGGDQSEFAIVGNQLGYSPLWNFGMGPNSSIWVDLGWSPDVTKPYPDRYAQRLTRAYASYWLNDTETIADTAFMKVFGTFDVRYADVIPTPPAKPGRLSVQASAGSLFVRVPQELAGSNDIELCDLLGHVVARWPGVMLAQDEMAKFVLPNLATGVYIVRSTHNDLIRSEKLLISR
ncbi:MAG: IgGFc-binding protein [Bacteroidetes bacterium]|nr:IgGFc-binding protein [Bacteroidota bacterium]